MDFDRTGFAHVFVGMTVLSEARTMPFAESAAAGTKKRWWNACVLQGLCA